MGNRFYSSMFLVIFILGFLGLIFMHELVHVEIYRSYGIESHVEYFSHFPDVVTIAEKPCPDNICELAHNINEIVGYPLIVLYLVFGMALFLIIKSIEEGKYDNRKKAILQIQN